MNCDQAFDVMTSPCRQSDRGLPVHLAGCPRCREMLDTLEPALGLFHTDFSAAPSLSPWEVASEGHEVATQAARRLTSAAPPVRQGLNALWGYAAAVVVGAGFVCCTLWLSQSAFSTPSVQRQKVECAYLAAKQPTGMSGRQMTESCLACHVVTNGQ